MTETPEKPNPMRWTSFRVHKIGPFREPTEFHLPEKTKPGAEIHIFTGTNGTGKSTLLRCFAGYFEAGYEPLLRRIHPVDDSLFMPHHSGHKVFEVFHAEHTFLGGLSLWLAPSHSARAVLSALHLSGHLTLQRFVAPYSLPYAQILKAPPIEYACFGYAGSRNLKTAPLTAISEVAEGPLQQAMSFENSIDSNRLVQWVATTKAKEAFAAQKRDQPGVERYARALERIHLAISKIAERPVAFELEDAPLLQVRVMWDRALLDLDVLPDGLKSILSWIGDLLMRLDRIPWKDQTVDATSQPFALFLDEIDVHLHPRWQRTILPVVQELFPNAQIFVATHSPFVVSSIEGGWVHRLDLHDDGSATNRPAEPSRGGYSYEAVVAEDFGIREDFDVETERTLAEFRRLRMELLAGRQGERNRLKELSEKLMLKSPELRDLIGMELRQIQRLSGIDVLQTEHAA